MNPERIRELLKQVEAGELTADQAMQALKWAPYEDVGGYARLDVHRRLRTGCPEVVYCESKTSEQVCGIVNRLATHENLVLATRAKPDQAEAILRLVPHAVHHETARIVEIRSTPRPESEADRSVLVIAAGTSDLPVAEEAAVTAECLGSSVGRLYDVGVAGLHRFLDAREQVDSATAIIVVAGMDGALPSVVGGLVDQPVIAVPTSVGYGASFQGLAALLTMLNSCAPGIAVVNIDNGFGAGYYAHLITRQ